MRRTTPRRHVAREFVERSVVASYNAIFRLHARRTPRQAPGRGRAPEPRDQLRATEGDRAGACARRPAGEFRVQGRARAPAVRDVALEPPAPAPVQALERPGIRYPTRPRRISDSWTLESLDRRRRRWLKRDVTNCWRSSAALYSEFSRRSPCARARSISFGSTKLISWFRRSTSAWSFSLSSASIGAKNSVVQRYVATSLESGKRSVVASGNASFPAMPLNI